MPDRHRSIRRLLQWLLLVVLLPLSLLLLYTGYRGYQRALSQAEQQSLNLAQMTADHVEGVVRQAQALLTTLSQRPRIRAYQPGEACDPVFAEALSINPLFANFNLVNLKGEVVCSSIPLPVGKSVSVRDTPWFPRMLKEQRFLISEPFVGRVSGRQVAMLAVPVRDAQGRMTGSLQLPLDLQKFKLLGADKISDNTMLAVINQQGTMVARSLQPEKFIGHNLLSTSEIVRIVVAMQRGTQVARSSEGVERIYGFVPIHSTPWFAIAGVSTDSVLGEVRLEVIQIFFIGLAVMVLVLWGAIILQRQIVRPISELQRVAGQIAAGDLSVRAAISGPAEIDAVATQFNLMLDALNQQVHRLAMSEAEMRGLFMGSLHAIMRVHEDGGVLLVNPSACQLFNRSADALQGLAVQTLLSGEDPSWFDRLLARQDAHLKLYATIPGEMPLPCEGSAVVQSSAEGVRTVNLFLRDLRDQLKQTELLAAKEAADIASRAKTEFLARMSHELRTPLNAILGFAQLVQLMPALQGQPKVLEMNRFIQDAGEHLLALVEEVLDLSRIEAGQLNLARDSIDLVDLLRRCQTLTEQLADRHHIGVTLHADLPDAQVCGDATRMRQVLLNLISNAIKYNREGGRVELRVQVAGPDILVTVQDTGRGMSAEQLANLYQPFNRLGAEKMQDVSGTGLGLVISRQLVEAMGGSIQVVSAEGQGTVFTVRFPRH